ncbi:hypothetical protein [Flavobacterium columnare]|nr:hypothetical protein [Flavobacterium columnare]
MGAREAELANEVDHVLHPTIHNPKDFLYPQGSIQGDFDFKIVGIGNTSLGYKVLRYNRRKINGVLMENDESAYHSYINTLNPFLRKHIEYMDFIRKDCSDGNNGNLFEKLYAGRISQKKINNAQRPGIHTEVQILNELIKDKTINSVQDIQALNIMIVVKIKAKNFENSDDHQHMCTCPHCFYITQGVNFIKNE